jgi:FkbM family methyltransferase
MAAGTNINIGACAIWAAARGYDVIAFEPKPIHIAMLKATAALRPEIGRRITLHEIGLSDEPTAGAMLVSEDSNSGNSWIFKPTQEAPSSVLGIGGALGATVSSDAGISLGRLDDYCAEPIDVLKVDTQGFEGHIFRGALGLMRKGAIKHIGLSFGRLHCASMGLTHWTYSQC